MFKVIDWVILVVLVSLAILIGFIAKFQKWRVKWHERCEKKRKLARRIDLDPDGEFALDVTETTLMAAAAAAAAANANGNNTTSNGLLVGPRGSRTANLADMSSPSSTLLSAAGGLGGTTKQHKSVSMSSGAGITGTSSSNGPSRPSFVMNAISLVIGFQTSTSIVGLPLEFYYYGAHSYQFALCMFVAPILIAFFFVPFLYKIKSASIYDYLEEKFGHGSRQVKNFTLLLSILFQFVFASLVLFSTAIACMQIVSSNSSSTSSSSSSSIEIWMVSTCLGILSALLALMGLRSVVLANFLQYLIMVACNLLIIILGIKNFSSYNSATGNQTSITSGGEGWSTEFARNFQRMWNVTKESGRGEFFEFNENFRTRYTFWNGLIGLMFNTLPSYCLTQQSYMRIKQAKSVRSARLLVVSIAPIGFFNLVLILTLGLVMSAYFHVCGDGSHTLRPGEVAHVNQLFTRFLAQFYANYHGLFGLFIALLVSSAIGTLSSVLKALSVVLSQEMLRPNASNAASGTTAHRSSRAAAAASFSYAADANYDALGAATGPTSELSRNASFARPQLVRNTRHTITRLSGGEAPSDIDNLYEEHLLSIQIAKMTRKRKERVLKKFLNKREKGARYLSKKVVSILIVTCSMFIILASIGLNYVPGSLTSVAFSIMNAIHGPVLFIYLCARFNDYSLKRHKYAIHRSTISKLRNFQFVARDVIASCVLAIIVVEALFIGRLVTSTQSATAKSFYQADRVTVTSNSSLWLASKPSTNHSSLGFCPYYVDSNVLNNSTTTTTAYLLDDETSNYPITSTSQTASFGHHTEQALNFFYYFFAISFNWYPFIGFFVCCFSLALFNLSRLILKMLLKVCLAFKCFLKCC